MFSTDEKEILRRILSEEPGLNKETVERLYRDILDRDFSFSTDQPEKKRWDHEIIESLIPHRASVLDLGCGTGELLQRLHEKKGVMGQGIDRNLQSVQECLNRAVPVIMADIDEGLSFFADLLYDYVVLEATVQTAHRPLHVLQEMLRVGKVGIVSFPNFGHWRIRMQLLVEGCMPRTRQIPHTWYESPNIHHLTIRDFEQTCELNRFFIAARYAWANGQSHPLIPEDNLLAEQALYVLSSKGPR